MTGVWFGVYLLATQGFLTLAALMGYAHWQGLPMNINGAREMMGSTEALIQVALVVNLLSLPLIILMVKSKRGSVWRDYMAWRPVGLARTVLWVIICLLSVFAMGILHQALGWRESGFMDELPQMQSRLWLILSVVVAAPIFEEMVFRGFVYGGFERSLGAFPALLLSSMLFTVLHGQYNWYELAQIFVLGMVLGLARMRTQSLFTPIVMHAVNNGMATAMVFFAQQSV
jgi:hypothetical protein